MRRKYLNWTNLIMVLANLVFIYIWGVLNWGDAEVGSNGWWFDELGHVISGFGWFFIWLHLIRSYMPATYLVTNKTFLGIVIVAIVTIAEAILWEGGELLWDLKIQPDYVSFLAKAQKGSVDTILDILFTFAAAFLAMALWEIWRKFCSKKWPDITKKEAAMEAKAKARLLAEEILKMERAHRKQVLKEIFAPLRRRKEKNQS